MANLVLIHSPSKEDRAWAKRLAGHLAPAARQNVFFQIFNVADGVEMYEPAVMAADLTVFIVSADFYMHDEGFHFLERCGDLHRSGEHQILLLRLRSCLMDMPSIKGVPIFPKGNDSLMMTVSHECENCGRQCKSDGETEDGAIFNFVKFMLANLQQIVKLRNG